MEIVLGLTAAAGWGLASFLGRSVARGAGVVTGIIYSRFISFSILSVYLLALGAGDAFNAETSLWAWGIAFAAGILNVGANIMLLNATRDGVVSIVIPITSSNAAVTVLLSLLSGERISLASGIGIFVIMMGVVFAATPARTGRQPVSPATQRTAVLWALGAAISFGTSLWMLGFFVTQNLGGVVPVWISRLIGFVALGIYAWTSGRRDQFHLPRPRLLLPVAASSVAATIAFVANNAGYNLGRVAIVAVLASLSSAFAVLLAGVVLRERLSVRQWAGVGAIIIGVIFVSLPTDEPTAVSRAMFPLCSVTHIDCE